MKKDLLIYGLTSLVAAGIAVSYYNKPAVNETVKQEPPAVIQQQTVAQISPYGKLVDHDVMDCLKIYVEKKFEDIEVPPILVGYDHGVSTIAIQGKLLNYILPSDKINPLMEGIYYRTLEKDPFMITKKTGHRNINIIFSENGFTIKTTNKLEEFIYNANGKVKDKLIFAGDEYEDLNGDGKIDLSITHSNWQEAFSEDLSKANDFFQDWKKDHSVDLAKNAYTGMMNRVKCVAYEQHSLICQKQ